MTGIYYCMRIQQLPATLANLFDGNPGTFSNIAPTPDLFALSAHLSAGDILYIAL